MSQAVPATDTDSEEAVVQAPRRRRAPRGQGERLREEIIDATERLLLEKGDQDAVSIRAVADAVGVSPPSIYLHFADKNDLIFAVCERHFARFDAVLQEARAAQQDPVQSLLACGHAYVRFGLENPEHYRILFMTKPEQTPDSWTAEKVMGSAAFEHLVEAVAEAVETIDVQPRPDPVFVSISLWSIAHGITSLLLTHPQFPWPDRDELISYVLSMPILGLLPR
ncbi:MAG TPA: TetR/AcrR family transcriptional regulator [Actinomycetota bacterium]|nr:TetR/AcrR family transcriptional regulator [Actinomycetota bacterium]